MRAESPVPPPAPPRPPRPDEPWIGPGFVWVAAAVAALLLILAIVGWRRRRDAAETAVPPEPPAPGAEPPHAPVEPLPAVFGPPPPEITPESAPASADTEPVLPAIPRDSTEWMEGDVREGEDVPEVALRSIAELLEALRTGEPRVCDAAVAELTRHGRAAIPALEQALIDEDPDVRVDAARALAAIRGGAA